LDTRAKNGGRMEREAQTVEAMIGLYCRGVHGNAADLCAVCAELRDYARQCLQECPFQADKTTCARCPIHCYKPQMREQIRAVMRYAGPRMLLRHPILAVRHLADGLRKEPARDLLPAAGRSEGHR